MPRMSTMDRLPFTGDDEADRLLASDALALLIGFALDQQVTVPRCQPQVRCQELGERIGRVTKVAVPLLGRRRPERPRARNARFRHHMARLQQFGGSVQQLADVVV